MSVINQMLKDLESRRPADTSAQGLLSGEGNHRRSGLDRKWLLVSLLIALLALTLAYLLWERFTTPEQATPTRSTTAEAAPPQTRPAATVQPPTQNTPLVAKPELRPVPVKTRPQPTPTPGPEKAKVMPPPALLAVKPSTVTGSWQAQTLTLVGRNLPKAPRIQVSWRDGDKVLPPEQVQWRDSEHLSISLTTGTDADTWTVTLAGSKAEPLHFLVEAPLPAAPPAPVETAEAAVGETLGIEKRIRPLRPEQLAEQHYQQGYRLLQRRDQAGAEKMWREALRIDPRHIPSREGLAGLYLSRSSNIEAADLLSEGLKHHPGHGPFATLYARLQVENGQLDTAINVLEQALAQQTQNADFLAFLAALYQRQKAFDKSIATYQQALRLQPHQGVWWMGMGISLESAGKPGEAITAFNEAMQSGNLPPRLRDYVDGRLQALQ
jgi:MSHA biogenesis protein MshN